MRPVNSLTTAEAPSDLQNRYEYDANGFCIYAGYAARGSAQGDTKSWILHKFTYDVKGNVTIKQTAFDSWTNRTVATYE